MTLDNNTITTVPAPLQELLSSPDMLYISGLPSLTLDDVQFKKVDSSSVEVLEQTYTLDSTMKIGTTTVPIVGTLTTARRNWLIVANPTPQTAITLPAIADIVQWSGADAVLDSLPPTLRGLSDVTLNYLSVQFDPIGQTSTSIAFGLSSQQAWPLIPDRLTIDNVGMEFVVTHYPYQEDQLESIFLVRFNGSLRVGSTSVHFSADVSLSGDWVLTADLNNNAVLPSLAEWKSWLGTGDIAATLPQGLGEINAFTVTEMSLTCDPATSVLSAAALVLALPHDLIAPTLFLPNGIQATITVPYTANQPASKTTSTLTAQIADVAIPITAESSSGSTGLALLGTQPSKTAVALNDIALHFLPETEVLPVGLPPALFSNLTVRAIPEQGLFTLRGTSTDTWGLLEHDLLIRQVDVEIIQESGFDDKDTLAGILLNFKVTLQGGVQQSGSAEFLVENFTLDFEWLKESEWKVAGNVAVTLFGKRFTLSELPFLRDANLTQKQVAVTVTRASRSL